MDIIDALQIWNDIGTTNEYTDSDNNYVISFIDSAGSVVGNITVFPGQGISWCYPEELMLRKKILDLIKTN